MRICSLLIASVLLTGCATQKPARKPTPDIAVSEIKPTPVCQGEAQCGEMWGRAIEYVQTATRMKVMTASDTFIQTYPTSRIGYMNGRVYKQSLGNGAYAIKGTFDCNPYSWCENLKNRTLSLFNMGVQDVDQPVSLPAASQGAAPAQSKTRDQAILELQSKGLPYEQYTQEYRKILQQYP